MSAFVPDAMCVAANITSETCFGGLACTGLPFLPPVSLRPLRPLLLLKTAPNRFSLPQPETIQIVQVHLDIMIQT